jgi:hypothetical protein
MPKVKKSNVPVRLRITAKNSVEMPIIRARVPAIDTRSFQARIILHQWIPAWTGPTYISCSQLLDIDNPEVSSNCRPPLSIDGPDSRIEEVPPDLQKNEFYF